MNRKIIVPTDFTRAAAQAANQAASIAQKAGWSLTLFHVCADRALLPEARANLGREAEVIRQRTGLTCDILAVEGHLLDAVPRVAGEGEFGLMVVGTHGARGMRQMIFGADIVKLIARGPVPVLVVQADSPLIERFDRIVLPVGSHDNFHQAVEAVLLFAGIYDPEVHLYSISKPGFEWPLQMLTNIEAAKETLEKHGVRMVRVKEEQQDPSQNWARQTLRYARKIGADTLWMMSVPSQDYYYLAKAYKELLLLNEDNLPVLCAGGGG